jgi:deazaflavin-dependent oxidoreductase (nitroreductase family)
VKLKPKRPEGVEKGDWLPGSRAGTWVFSHVMPVADKVTYRLSGGRKLALPYVGQLNTVMLTTTGAKSGKSRSHPVVAFPDGKDIIVVASNWGKANNPAWYYNILANSAVEVEHNGKSAVYQARVVMGAERKIYWKKAVSYYSVYEVYAERSGRELPIMVLKPSTKKKR